MRYPGSAHDARIWAQSSAKPYLTGQPWYLAGDAGYPLSSTLIKPFANPVTNDKRLFNVRLSGAWTMMTENVFGIWKQCFPVLTNMRFHHEKAMKAVVVTAILHNFAITEKDNTLGDFDELPPYVENPNQVFVEDLRGQEQIRQAGVLARNRIVAEMPGPRTAKERRI